MAVGDRNFCLAKAAVESLVTYGTSAMTVFAALKCLSVGWLSTGSFYRDDPVLISYYMYSPYHISNFIFPCVP